MPTYIGDSSSVLGFGCVTFESPSLGTVFVNDVGYAELVRIEGSYEEEWPDGRGPLQMASGELRGKPDGLRCYWTVTFPYLSIDVLHKLIDVYNACVREGSVVFTPASLGPWFTMQVVNDGPFPIKNIDDRKMLPHEVTLRFKSRHLWRQIPKRPDITKESIQFSDPVFVV